MTVRDLIRSLYIACDGNLDMPFLGICLSGGEAMAMQQYPYEYDERTGKENLERRKKMKTREI